MSRVAALWYTPEGVDVHCSHPGPVLDLLNSIGTRTGPSSFVVDHGAVEDVLNALDRAGFTWSIGEQVPPRTWAQRMFAEVPDSHHEELYRATWDALDGLDDHRALLRTARPRPDHEHPHEHERTS